MVEPPGPAVCGAGLQAVEGGGGEVKAVDMEGGQGDQGEPVNHTRGTGHQEDAAGQETEGAGLGESFWGAAGGCGEAPGVEEAGPEGRQPIDPAI